MKRDPSIHITLSSLVAILDNIGIQNPKDTAAMVLLKASKHTLVGRQLIVGNTEIKKKLSRTANNNTAAISAERFNTLLTSCRIKAGHRSVKNIAQNDINYNNLKDVAKLASDFAKDFGIDNIESACKIFITIGLGYMKRSTQYSINKFKFYNEKIRKQYECEQAIKEDLTPEATAEFHEIWAATLFEYAEVERDLNTPEDYVNMVYGKQDADKAQASYKDWVKAQFEILSYMDVVPPLGAMHGDNAISRYYEYITNIKKPEKPSKTFDQSKQDFWDSYKKKAGKQ